MINMHVLTVCRIAGIFPLVYRGSAFGISWRWLLYSVIMLLVNTCIQISFLMNESSVAGVSGFFKTTSIFQRLYKMVCIPVCLYYITKNHRTLSKYSRILSSLSTSEISRGFKNPNESKYASYILPFFLFCTCSDAVLEISVRNMVITAVAQFLAHFPVICIIFHFVHFVDEVNSKLKGLIDDFVALKELARYNSIVSSKSEELELMSDVHYSISVAAGYLNGVYAPQYFTLVSGAVCVLIVNFYKATTYLSISDYVQSYQQACWTSFWMILLVTAILPAARASRTSSEFNIQLSELIARSQNKLFGALDDQVSISKLRVHVDFNYTVKFSCGFFELDRFLVHSIMGGIFSFSVILVQISPRSDLQRANLTNQH